MDVMDAIKTRRSIRSYLPKPIEDEILAMILEAARLAPTASNQQELKIVVVKEESIKNAMIHACVGQQFIAEAPVVLVMCSTKQRDMLCGQPTRTIDCSIAFSFILLEAQELGLGMCWIGSFQAFEIQAILGIPEDYEVVALAPIGYAANLGYKTSRKRISELVCYNKWA